MAFSFVVFYLLYKEAIPKEVLNMAVNLDVIKFLRKKPLVNPTAEQIQEEFVKLVEYCNTSGRQLTKQLWLVYLNVTRQCYDNWSIRATTSKDNVEFNDRVALIKKINQILEDNLSDMLMNSTKNPANFIFALKHNYQWRDKADDTASIEIKVGGWNAPKTYKTPEKEADKEE